MMYGVARGQRLWVAAIGAQKVGSWIAQYVEVESSLEEDPWVVVYAAFGCEAVAWVGACSVAWEGSLGAPWADREEVGMH